MMRSIVAVVRVDVNDAWRDGRLPVLFVLCLVLAAIAAWTGIARVSAYESERVAAELRDAETWVSQPAGNPHSIAHFSQMAYKPTTAFAAFDPGLTSYLGTTVWMEAHFQNPANHRPAEDTLDAQRFADLSPAWLLQILAPLFVVALGFSVLARERETGLWRSIAASGMSPRRLLAAKAASLAVLSLIVLSPILVAAIAAPLAIVASSAPDALSRAAGLLAGYGLYLLAFGACVLAISAWAGSSRRALILLGGVWALTVLAAPRLAANAADLLAPVPTSQAFWAQVETDLKQGMDGHAPADERAAAFEAQVLKEYGVSRKEDLPVSFAGLALRQSEREANKVFDRRFADLYGAYETQRGLLGGVGVVSPTLAVRAISDLLTGTDERAHRHFVMAAESHRRILVDQLNDDMIRNGKGADFDYIAPASLWAAMPLWSYASPALALSDWSRVAILFALLALWIATGGYLALLGVRRWSQA